MSEPATADPYDLERFVAAQQGVLELALGELRRGRKTSHWMWFIFPQLVGLGSSTMARRYAIRSLNEARAYLRHSLLGPRLRACTEALFPHTARGAEAILGPIDAVKLRSSMTLFREAGESVGRPELFSLCLDLFFQGEPDAATLRLLAGG